MSDDFPRLELTLDELRQRIPAEIVEAPRWVAWTLEVRDGEKPTKPPISPRGGYADTTRRATWGTLPEALGFHQHRADSRGLGFVLGEGVVGIDLDGAVNGSGPAPWAQAIVDRFPAAYVECSPSGEGLHLLMRGTLPRDGQRPGPEPGTKIECYSKGRYLTMTGDVVRPVAELGEHSAELSVFAGELWVERPEPTPSENGSSADDDRPPHLADTEVLRRARGAANGAKFAALFDRGDTSGHEEDDSSADLALVNLLAFWCGKRDENGHPAAERDRVQIDRLFRASKLFRPKWDERRGQTTYGRMTIAKALSDPGRDCYSGSGGQREKTAEPAAAAAVEYLDLTTIKANGIPPVPWILPGWLAAGDIALFSGDAGIGKSTTVAALAVAVATGGAWCGIQTERSGPVLIFDEEQSDDEVADIYLRLGAPVEGLRIACQQGVNLVTAEGVARLEREIAAHRPLLVVGDSVQQLFAGVDGKDAAQVATVYATLFRLRREYGCAFQLIGHLRKPPSEGHLVKAHLVHGSVAFSTQASTVWVASQPARDLMDVEQTKRRRAQRTSLRIRYQSEGDGAPIILAGEGQVETQETLAEAAQDFVVHYLAQHGVSPTGWIVAAGAAWLPPITERSIQRALRHLLDLSAVEKPRRGYYGMVTKPGDEPK